MSENFEELDARLKAADPANTDLPELHHTVLLRATKSKPKLSRRNKFVASVASAGVAVVALAVLATSSLTTASSPLFSLANGTRQSAETSAINGASTADMKLGVWNPVNYEYVADAEISDQGSSGHVYQIKPIKYLSAYMYSIADALGVDGKLVKQEYGSFTLNIDSMQNWNPTAGNISFDPSGYWYYTYPAAYPQYVCDSAEKAAPDTSNADCREVPVNAADKKPWPTKTQAIDLLKKVAGADLANFSDVDYTYTDDYQPQAVATVKVDGVATDISFVATWSTDGVLYMVQGQHVDLVDRGNFEMVSAKTAVERASDYRYTSVSLPPEFYGGTVGMLTADYATAKSSEIMADPNQPTSDSASAPATEETVEPAPEPEQSAAPDPIASENPKPVPAPDETLDPTAAPEPMPQQTIDTVTVLVTKAVKSVAAVYDSEGNRWLVPVWVLYGHEKKAQSTESLVLMGVLALKDGVIELPKYEERINGVVNY